MQCKYRWCFLIGIWPTLLIGCLESKLPKSLKKAEVLIEKGQPQSAVPVLEKFVSNYPLDPVGHMKLGDTYNLTGQTKKAIAEFREAISLLSNRPQSQIEARIKIVRTYLKIGLFMA